MKKFWPNRSIAKGFSIERLARKYREKISKVSSDENVNESLYDININSIKEDSSIIVSSNIKLIKGHWANRDFSEYRDAA